MAHSRLTQQVADAFPPPFGGVMGVAVSGGGDSMALLHLLHGFCANNGVRLRAVTVNHGLRAEAQQEAETVAAYCETLSVPHDTLLWDSWDGSGNLQARARDGRYALMAQWAAQHGINTVALGHTADDQAETVLMRLARRAGVDGLSAMPVCTIRDGINWVRPLLAASRSDLRAYLSTNYVNWIEDPSNEDTGFERVRVRQAMHILSDLGIDAEGLSVVAAQMGAARKALDWQTLQAARDIVTVESGAIVIDDARLRQWPEEIRRRLLVKAIGWIRNAPYAPRRAAVATLMQALNEGRGSTLDGCQAQLLRGHIWIFRELDAVREVSSAADGLWDARWRVSGDHACPQDAQNLLIRALGPAGLRQCPDWRALGRPRDVLLSTPAVWRGDTVVAAPLAGVGQNWHAELIGGPETFFASLLSH